ncbi:uncharacterized protein LOC124606342 [Schistocerca americana]|uniref:uncharacterized protein LOC124606342 n=1 Tax=Schistocerca americana TaxID=7009 RepID=UPI001F4F97F6|nr:uncharacterized protein LOC124606342 [Schistocerca americana]
MSALKKGLKYAPSPQSMPFADSVCGVERAAHKMPSEIAEEIRRETSRILPKSKQPTSNMTRADDYLRELLNDPHLVVLPADKGNAAVITERADYSAKIRLMLEEKTYKKLS